jgi:hypothetical protein
MNGMVHDFLVDSDPAGTHMQDFAQQSSTDTIGADGYDKKVYQFVKPNIVYQNKDVNYLQYDSENKLWRI